MDADIMECLETLLNRKHIYSFKPTANVTVESDGQGFANINAMNHATGDERAWNDLKTPPSLYEALREAHAFALGISKETRGPLNLDDLCAEMDTFPIITDD